MAHQQPVNMFTSTQDRQRSLARREGRASVSKGRAHKFALAVLPLLVFAAAFLGIHFKATQHAMPSTGVWQWAPSTPPPAPGPQSNAQGSSPAAGVASIKVTHQQASPADGQQPLQQVSAPEQVASCRWSSATPLPPALAPSADCRTYQEFNTSTGSRYYSIGTWRHTKPPDQQRMVYQQAGGVEGDMRFFVRAGSAGLGLGMDRWLLAGARLPDNVTDMAASGDVGKLQVLSMLQQAKQLGMNAIRVVAYKDGHTLPHAIQVAPGVLDELPLRHGLDWVVWQARLYGLRVVLVLTGAGPASLARGGMAQYIRWHDPEGNIKSFYRNDTYKAHYFDYMTALAVRENSYTRVQHRHDPAILGWDIADSAVDPGPGGGDDLQGWIPYMINFLRRIDPNHVIFMGGQGMFGASSPHHITLNPQVQARLPWLLPPPGQPPAPAVHSVCEGSDFLRNSMLKEVDMACMSLLPDAWLSCDEDCKMAWAKDWLAAHLRDALRMQKPLLVGQVEMSGPPHRQMKLQQMVLEYLNNASKQGLPIAGVFLKLPLQSICDVPSLHDECLMASAVAAAAHQTQSPGLATVPTTLDNLPGSPGAAQPDATPSSASDTKHSAVQQVHHSPTSSPSPGPATTDALAATQQATPVRMTGQVVNSMGQMAVTWFHRVHEALSRPSQRQSAAGAKEGANGATTSPQLDSGSGGGGGGHGGVKRVVPGWWAAREQEMMMSAYIHHFLRGDDVWSCIRAQEAKAIRGTGGGGSEGEAGQAKSDHVTKVKVVGKARRHMSGGLQLPAAAAPLPAADVPVQVLPSSMPRYQAQPPNALVEMIQEQVKRLEVSVQGFLQRAPVA